MGEGVELLLFLTAVLVRSILYGVGTVREAGRPIYRPISQSEYEQRTASRLLTQVFGSR